MRVQIVFRPTLLQYLLGDVWHGEDTLQNHVARVEAAYFTASDSELVPPLSVAAVRLKLEVQGVPC